MKQRPDIIAHNSCRWIKTMDLQDRIELLLKMMTRDCAEDDNGSEDSEFLDSSDQSDTESEQDKEDDTYPDTKTTSTEHYFNPSFHLNQFFEEIDEKRKCLTSNIENDRKNDIQFENKMYRVIPMKLNEISKLRNLSNRIHKQSSGRLQGQTKY